MSSVNEIVKYEAFNTVDSNDKKGEDYSKIELIANTVGQLIKRDSDESRRNETMSEKMLAIYEEQLNFATRIKNDPSSTPEQRKQAEQDYIRMLNEMKDIRNNPMKVQITKYLATIFGVTLISVAIIIRDKEWHK